MQTFLIAALLGAVGYVIGAFGGGVLVSTFSSNQHDRSLEAAMIGAFVCGPIAAVLTFHWHRPGISEPQGNSLA